MKKVNVLLSVFNGEKYIRQQLESLLNQSYHNIDIYVHDDGSADGTMEIVKEYIGWNSDWNRVLLMDLPQKLGYPSCFVDMLSDCPAADYYAFSDQDDVWKADKIERAVSALEGYDNIPALYYGAVDYCDANLQFVRKSRFADPKEACAKMSLQQMIIGGEAMGMTFCFNDTAKNALVKSKQHTNQFKDLFLKIYCASCGCVIYDSKSVAYYRRHESAVTNGTNPSGKIARYVGEIKNIFFGKEMGDHLRQIANYILQEEYKLIGDKEMIILKSFAEITLANQIKKFLCPHRYRKKMPDEIGYRLAFLLCKI